MQTLAGGNLLILCGLKKKVYFCKWDSAKPIYYFPPIMKKKFKVRDIIEYIVAVVNDFATHHNLTEKQAYRYLNIHGGISFIEENYGIIHTLSFREAVDSVALFCKNKGGKI